MLAVGPPLRGHQAPASNRGAAGQPRALVQPRGERLAPQSRRPASAARSTLQAVLKGDAAPRPAGHGPSSPPPRAAAAAAAAAKGRSHAPLSSGESARRAFAGPSDRLSGAPPFLPPASPTSPPFLPPSLACSQAPSLPLSSPPPLTERLPYKIYESALSSQRRVPSYSQGSGAQPRGAASQGVFAAPAPRDDSRPASIQIPALAPGLVVRPLECPSLAPPTSRSPRRWPSPRSLALRVWRSPQEEAGSVRPIDRREPEDAAQNPDHKSASLPISALAGAPSPSEARRLFPTQNSAPGPSRPASRAPRLLDGGCGRGWGLGVSGGLSGLRSSKQASAEAQLQTPGRTKGQ
ncbi:uncharacterized protein LOC143686663 [Tamandua tetradactyla]|uniref:uncharacterized protein LOC143686663 n=1 Tax=Tamandua tetradactyla TaxID=48850 RepID=UPI004053ABEC